MPQQGERKTHNGVTGEWDGTTWRRVAGDSLSQAVQGKGPTQSGFGNKSVDDLLAAAKGTLGATNRFGASIGSNPEAPAPEASDSNPNAFKQEYDEPYTTSMARYAGHELSGAADLGKVWDHLKSGVTGPLKGLAGIPNAMLETVKPDNLQESLLSPGNVWRALKSAPGDAADASMQFLEQPEEVGSGLAAAAIADKLPEALHSAVTEGPDVLRRAAAATGRGLEATGQALRPRGGLPAMTAVTGHPIMAAAEVAVPPALRGIGRALQKLGPKAEEGMATATSTGVPVGANVPASSYLKDLAKLSPADQLAELSARQAAREGGTLSYQGGRMVRDPEPLGDVAARARAGTEVPYRMGEPTGVNGLNEGIAPEAAATDPYAATRAFKSEITSPGFDVTKASGPAYRKSFEDYIKWAEDTAPRPVSKQTPFSHEQFVDQLKQSLKTGTDVANEVSGPNDNDLSEMVGLSPLDAASRLAKLSRMQRTAGAAYAE